MRSTRVDILYAAVSGSPDPWEWNIFYSPDSPLLVLFVRNVYRPVKTELTEGVMR